MNVIELLQEETTYEIGRNLNKELRDMALELDLTWGEMPGFVKAGAWYGGVIGPKGGIRGEGKREMTLPFDRRLKGFFKQLAKFLAKKQSEGHVVSVAPNTSKNGKPTPMKAEQLEEELLKTNVVHLNYAKARWYISFSEEQTASSMFIRLDGRVWGSNFASLYYDVAFTVGAKHKEIKKKLADIEKNGKQTSLFVADLLPIWKAAGGKLPAKEKFNKVLTFDEYVNVAKNPRFANAGTDAGKAQSGNFHIKGNVMAAGTLKLPYEEVADIIDKHWRAV